MLTPGFVYVNDYALPVREYGRQDAAWYVLSPGHLFVVLSDAVPYQVLADITSAQVVVVESYDLHSLYLSVVGREQC